MSNTVLPRILTVEDDQTFRETVSEILRDVGYKVKGARTLRKATKRLTKHKFDLVLTDVRMPGLMDGLALVAQVQIDHPAIRSIVVSGNASAEQASDAGALGFVAKPYLAQTMIQAVHDTVLRH